MKAVHFRCPKCQTQHSAVAAKAGQVFVCKTCFGPMIVPGAPEAPSSEIPTAERSPMVVPAVTPSAPKAGSDRMTPDRSIRVSRPAPAPTPSRRIHFVQQSLVIAALMVLVVGAIDLTLRARANHRQAESEALRAESQARAVADLKLTKVTAFPAIPAVPEVKSEEATPPVEPLALPAVKPEEPAPRLDADRPLVIRRRQTLDQEALRRHLAGLPEVAAQKRTESALIALHQVLPTGPQGRAVTASLTPQEREQLRKAALAERSRPRPSSPQPPAGTLPGRSPMHVSQDEGAPRDMLAMIREKQPELSFLPWRMGDECHLGRESAENLQLLSRALRNLLAKVTPQGDTRPDAELLRAALIDEPREEEIVEPQTQAAPPSSLLSVKRRKGPANKPRFVVPEAIPALQQLLMAERTPVRMVLVDVLDKIACKDATKGLARLAIFDLAPEVRERALLKLRARPTEDFRPSLIEGLRYPWAPVADHAAEALVALGDRGAVADLVALLDQPDPLRPRTEIRDGKPVELAPALVQVNHLQNCVLCHAPSGNAERDFVRGRVPDETQALPPPVEYYANSSPGLFVRADVTYLRQDFSVTQPVDDSGPWPSYQRYDYLLTEKPASTRRWDLNAIGKASYPQRDSVLFALRELTGRKDGTRSADWKDERLQPPAQ